MKRLKNILLGMQTNSTTYKEMYGGKIIVHDSLYPNMPPMCDDDPTYYSGDVAFEITATNKLAQSKPTVTIKIPADSLGITDLTPAAADNCLRQFAPYIDELNNELYNRFRPDSETGKYYLHRPGGGYSGKSTLLDAISAGIYDHAAGDGRELCITDNTAMTISAEDGRSVRAVNISPFIKWLPSGDTRDFSTDHASGSTSQAANIMEAVDCGARLLLIDEDRSATNFMIRDKMMKELIKKEPITPFTDRVNELFAEKGVSTILVIGGSGEYLAVADKIYMMDDFIIHDVTDRAHAICQKYGVTSSPPVPVLWEQKRTIYSLGFTSYPENSGSERLEVSDMGFIIIGDEMIDIRGLHDIITKNQLDCIGYMLRWIAIRNTEDILEIDAWLDRLYADIEKEGLDIVFSSFFTTTKRFLDLPRKCELKAVINRMRKVKFSGDII